MEVYAFTDDEFATIDDILYKHGTGITPDEMWIEIQFLYKQSEPPHQSMYVIYDYDTNNYLTEDDMINMLDEAMCDVNWKGLSEEQQGVWASLLIKHGILFRGGY